MEGVKKDEKLLILKKLDFILFEDLRGSKITVSQEIAEISKQKMMKAYLKKDYAKSIASGHQAKQAVGKMKLFLTEKDKKEYSEACNLEKEILFDLRRAEAKNLMLLVDKKAEKFYKEEEVDFDVMCELFDEYREAIRIVREEDQEIEAIAMSKLGVLSYRGQKNEEKALQYIESAMVMADTMLLDSFKYEEWFVTADKVLKELKEKMKKESSIKVGEAKAEYETEFKKLESLVDSPIDFITYVKKAHPPKTGLHTLEISKDKIRGIVRIALNLYSPDKNKAYGEKWIAISGEISRHLNSILDKMRREDH